MSDYDKEQESVLAKQHHRLAMGVPLSGQALEPTGKKTESDSKSEPKGGLSSVKEKK